MEQKDRGWKHITYENQDEAEKMLEMLVEPVKKIIEAAYDRLKERGMTDENRIKRIYLEIRNSRKHRVFEIADVDVGDWDILDPESKRRNLSCGFFIYVMNIDKGEIPFSMPDGIQIPRVPEPTTVESINHLKGLAPEAVAEAIGDIQEASVITELQWLSYGGKAPRER